MHAKPLQSTVCCEITYHTLRVARLGVGRSFFFWRQPTRLGVRDCDERQGRRDGEPSATAWAGPSSRSSCRASLSRLQPSTSRPCRISRETNAFARRLEPWGSPHPAAAVLPPPPSRLHADKLLTEGQGWQALTALLRIQAWLAPSLAVWLASL